VQNLDYITLLDSLSGPTNQSNSSSAVIPNKKSEFSFIKKQNKVEEETKNVTTLDMNMKNNNNINIFDIIDLNTSNTSNTNTNTNTNLSNNNNTNINNMFQNLSLKANNNCNNSASKHEFGFIKKTNKDNKGRLIDI